MLTFHPYGQQDTRVVSDASRFEFTPRNRSRNPTPPSASHDIREESFVEPEEPEILPEKREIHNTPSKKLNLVEIAERSKLEEDKMDFYDDYMQESEQGDYYKPPPPQLQSQPNVQKFPNEYQLGPLRSASARTRATPTFTPYPESIATSLPAPTLPLKDPKYDQNYLGAGTNTNRFSNPDTLHDNYIPTQLSTQPRTLAEQLQNKNDEIQSIISKKKNLEEQLIKSVMNRPLFTIPTKRFVGFNNIEETEFIVSYNVVLYIFEFIFAITIITLSGILLDKDVLAKSGVYRFFIADGSITLFVSFLFLAEVINFEKRNGSFYCLLACVMNLVSFIMAVSSILPDTQCLQRSYCRMRKAVCSFIIISTFAWFSNLVMFLTTFYISRLNLLGDINFDFSDKGLAGQYNKEFPEPQPQLPNQQLEKAPFPQYPPFPQETPGISRAPSGIAVTTPQEVFAQQQRELQLREQITRQQQIREQEEIQRRQQEQEVRAIQEQQEYAEFQEYKFQKQKRQLERQVSERVGYPQQSAIPKTPQEQQLPNFTTSRMSMKSKPQVLYHYLDDKGRIVDGLFEDENGNIVLFPKR